MNVIARRLAICLAYIWVAGTYGAILVQDALFARKVGFSSTRHMLRISYFLSDSRPIFSPMSSEMLKFHFLFRERVQNGKF